MKPETVYLTLVNDLLSTLHKEVLVLGVFVVCFGYLRHVMKVPALLSHVGFWQRFLLLTAITLFSSYIAITYFLEGETSYSFQDFQKAFSNDSEEMKSPLSESGQSAIFLIIVMLPIDFVGVICMAGSYLALAREEFLENENTITSYPDINSALFPLFFFTGTWHFIMILWWAVFSKVGRNELATDDIAYHGYYCLLHLISLSALCYFGRSRKENSSLKPLCQWSFIGIYVMLTMSVYAYRTYAYMGSVLDSSKKYDMYSFLHLFF